WCCLSPMPSRSASRKPRPRDGATPILARSSSCSEETGETQLRLPDLPAGYDGAQAATGMPAPVPVENSAVTYAVELGPTRYAPRAERYEAMSYRRCGRSGLQLPAISLGLWQNFGDDRPLANSRAMVRRAFDLGITHFDLANNYGPPYGSAESNFGRIFAEDLRPHRDELVISTKAGYDMWPGPYGEFGSRKYLLASLDQSLH